LNFFKDC